jgi:hypothetical protein
MLLTSVKDHHEYIETKIRELRIKLQKLSTLILTGTTISRDDENEYKKLHDQHKGLISQHEDIHAFIKEYIQRNLKEKKGALTFYIPYSFVNHRRAIVHTGSITKEGQTDIIPKPIPMNRPSPTSALRDLIFRIFPFSNEEQCKTTKRSAKEYITKTDMVKLINENEVLKRRMSKDYKKQSKDDLCKQVAIVGKL